MDILAFFTALEPETQRTYREAMRSGYIDPKDLDRAVAHSAAITAQKQLTATKENTEGLYALGNVCLELQTMIMNRA